MKKLLSIICTISLLLMIVPLGVSANSLDSEINTFLLNSGVPEEVVNSLSLGQKEMIYDTIGNSSAEFCGCDIRSFELNNNVLESTGTVSISANDEIQPQSGLISNSDLVLSVVGFKSTDGSTTEYYVYPSFEWKKPVKVKNDSFAMSMYNGWEAIPGKRNLRLHLHNYEGESVQYVDLNPTNANSSGYSYKVPSSIGFMQGMYQGHAYYILNKTSSSATAAISLHYVHDNSSAMNLSYSLNVGAYGSISISGDVSQADVMSDNFDISGLK